MPYMVAKCDNPGLQRIVAEVHKLIDDIKDIATPDPLFDDKKVDDKATVGAWWVIYRLEDVLDLLQIQDQKLIEQELETTKSKLKEIKEVHEPELKPLKELPFPEAGLEEIPFSEEEKEND